jgi:hypothetical protein
MHVEVGAIASDQHNIAADAQGVLPGEQLACMSMPALWYARRHGVDGSCHCLTLHGYLVSANNLRVRTALLQKKTSTEVVQSMSSQRLDLVRVKERWRLRSASYPQSRTTACRVQAAASNSVLADNRSIIACRAIGWQLCSRHAAAIHSLPSQCPSYSQLFIACSNHAGSSML